MLLSISLMVVDGQFVYLLAIRLSLPQINLSLYPFVKVVLKKNLTDLHVLTDGASKSYFIYRVEWRLSELECRNISPGI